MSIGVSQISLINRTLHHFVTKCGGDFYDMHQVCYYKMRQKFIIKCVRYLLQNAKVLLQNVIAITKWNGFIIKCDTYYKIWCLLQNVSVHCFPVSQARPKENHLSIGFANNLKVFFLTFSAQHYLKHRGENRPKLCGNYAFPNCAFRINCINCKLKASKRSSVTWSCL